VQIHDELVFEVRKDVLPAAALLVKEAMERAVELRVPLPVKLKTGSSWGHLHEYRPPQP
jgi:DNA polymerase I